MTVGGKERKVEGFGFHDHSWGRRDWDVYVASRDFQVCLGPDLYMNVTGSWRDGKQNVVGYVCDDGVVYPARELTSAITVGDDYCTPKRVWLRVTTDKRSYEGEGEVDGCSINTVPGDFLHLTAFVRYRMDGRDGSGVWAGRDIGTVGQLRIARGH
jgi:hypothetical protein